MPSQWPGGVRPKGVIPVPVVVGGSRTIKEYHLKTICRYLDKRVAWFDDVVLYHGGQVSTDEKTGAKFGADFLADLWAQYHWIERHIFHKDIDKWGDEKTAVEQSSKEMIKTASKASDMSIACFFVLKRKPIPSHIISRIKMSGKCLGWENVFVKHL